MRAWSLTVGCPAPRARRQHSGRFCHRSSRPHIRQAHSPGHCLSDQGRLGSRGAQLPCWSARITRLSSPPAADAPYGAVQAPVAFTCGRPPAARPGLQQPGAQGRPCQRAGTPHASRHHQGRREPAWRARMLPNCAASRPGCCQTRCSLELRPAGCTPTLGKMECRVASPEQAAPSNAEAASQQLQRAGRCGFKQPHGRGAARSAAEAAGAAPAAGTRQLAAEQPAAQPCTRSRLGGQLGCLQGLRRLAHLRVSCRFGGGQREGRENGVAFLRALTAQGELGHARPARASTPSCTRRRGCSEHSPPRTRPTLPGPAECTGCRPPAAPALLRHRRAGQGG